MISAEERDIMRCAYIFLRDHCDPPAAGDEGAADWWIRAAREASGIWLDWRKHPLAKEVLTAVYIYIGEKARTRERAARENGQAQRAGKGET